MTESRSSRQLSAAQAEAEAWRELYQQSQRISAFWQDIAEGRNPLTGEPECARCRDARIESEASCSTCDSPEDAPTAACADCRAEADR